MISTDRQDAGATERALTVWGSLIGQDKCRQRLICYLAGELPAFRFRAPLLL